MTQSGTADFDLARGWRIELAASAGRETGPAATAAEELDTTLAAIAGGPREGAGLVLRLSHRPAARAERTAPARDGFVWNADTAEDGSVTVRLAGHTPAGLLYAAYAFLEALGCAWPGHRPQDARLPRGTRFRIPAARAEHAGFAGRCLILGHHAFLAEAEAWIAWAARNRLNTLFVHTAEDGLALGAAPMAQWQAMAPRVKRALARTGMTLELGGHGLSRLLPRALFETMPDAFRMKDGARTPDHNLDPLDADGMAHVRANARAWFQAHPGAKVYHLWPDDIPGGGWSYSPACEGLSASDQALIAANALAEELEAIDPAAEVAHIAYHDTEDAPRAVRPRANVSLLWAPRMRCYARGTADPACPVNARYPARLAASTALFEEAAARPARVFEYYLDAILFKSVLPPLAGVMAEDAAAYRAAGIHTWQALMVGGRPWAAPQVNAYVFARLAWDATPDPQAATRSFCTALAGNAAGDHLVRHFAHLENAFARALDFGPGEAQPAGAAGAGRFLDEPPTDMGDPWHAGRDDLRARLAVCPAIAADVDAAARALAAARAETDRPDAIAGLETEFALTRLWFRFHEARLALYLAFAEDDADATATRLGDAYAACDAVDAWAHAHIAEARYRDNTILLHWLFWRLRLDWIRECTAPGEDARAAIRAEREADMAARFARAATLWQD